MFLFLRSCLVDSGIGDFLLLRFLVLWIWSKAKIPGKQRASRYRPVGQRWNWRIRAGNYWCIGSGKGGERNLKVCNHSCDYFICRSAFATRTGTEAKEATSRVSHSTSSCIYNGLLYSTVLVLAFWLLDVGRQCCT